MFGKLMLSAMTLFMACKAFAVQLSPQEALARMNNTQAQSKGIVSTNSAMQLAYTSSFKGVNTYYVFNKDNNNGFVILSADDCMPVVLGVVDRGNFDINNMPENMKWWLCQYDSSISDYASKGKKYVSSVTKEDIAPLLGNIAYGQYEPYNNLCPEHDGQKTVTGCIATAMAQIMRMHKWPERGVGEKEYKYYSGSEIVTLKNDFTQSIYQWDKMPETYIGHESHEEKLAVARLMYDCGVSVKMIYGTDGSGGWGDVGEALVTHFNYDRNIIHASRSYYEDAEWEDLIYENLSKGLPIYYEGYNEEGGHAFVCDGYQANGNLFHFNWGWDGSSNGYFLMTGNGNGHREITYNSGQSAILNINPASEPIVDKEVEFPWTVSNPYDIYVYNGKYSKAKKVDENFEIIGKPFILRYNGPSYRRYAIATKFKSEKFEFIHTITERGMPPTYALKADWIEIINILRNGKYEISFVYKDLTAGDTEWKEMQYLPGVKKPVVEIVGIEKNDFYIYEKPELIYDGKVIVNDTLTPKSNVKDFTIRLKLKALKNINASKIDVNISGGSLSWNFQDSKTITVPALSKDATHTVDITYPIEKLKPDFNYFVSFHQNDWSIIPYTYYNDISFTVVETPTGIDAITLNEEKKATKVIYNIYGQKVKSMNKGGIYITGGKKFISK